TVSARPRRCSFAPCSGNHWLRRRCAPEPESRSLRSRHPVRPASEAPDHRDEHGSEGEYQNRDSDDKTQSGTGGDGEDVLEHVSSYFVPSFSQHWEQATGRRVTPPPLTLQHPSDERNQEHDHQNRNEDVYHGLHQNHRLSRCDSLSLAPATKIRRD